MSEYKKPPREGGPWARPREVEQSNQVADPRKQFEEAVERDFRALKEGREGLGQDIDAMIVFASYFLNHPFAEFHEEFSVGPTGALQPTLERDMSIAAWAPVTAQKGEVSAEDMRAAAAKLLERYPQLRFSFFEDRQKNLFSYTATLVGEDS